MRCLLATLLLFGTIFLPFGCSKNESKKTIIPKNKALQPKRESLKEGVLAAETTNKQFETFCNENLNLETLTLRSCYQIENLKPITQLKKLRTLVIDHCALIRDLTPIENVTQLQSLTLKGLRNLSDLTPLQNLKQLTYLNLRGARSVANLAPLIHLKRLNELILRRCLSINDFTPLSQLTSLKRLYLNFCPLLSNLKALRPLQQLELLHIQAYQGAGALTPLAHLKNLRALNLSGSRDIKDFSPLSKIKSLRILNLAQCVSLTSIEPITGLMRLQRLDLTWCEGIGDAGSMAMFPALKEIGLPPEISDAQLKRICELHPNITGLNLDGCKLITTVKPFADLNQLKILSLQYCRRIADIYVLESIASLRTVICKKGPVLSEEQMASFRDAMPDCTFFP